MKPFGIILLLLIATHAEAQSIVYTNRAGLALPPRVALPEGEYAWLRAHSFVAGPERGTGPTVTIIGDPRRGAALGPWDFPPMPPARRLDGTLLTQPAEVYGGNPYGLYFVPYAPPVIPRRMNEHIRSGRFPAGSQQLDASGVSRNRLPRDSRD